MSLSKQKTDLIHKIAIDHGLSSSLSIDVKSGSIKGDNYLGIIYIIEVVDSSSGKSLNFILKCAQNSSELRKQAPVKKAYEREIFMYETVFKEMTLLQNQYEIINKFEEIAKFLGGSLENGEECLALENLKEISYQLWNRKVAMDDRHVALVFSTYGKFHGMSLALRQLKPKLFEELSQNLVNIFDNKETEENMDIMFTNLIKNAFEAIDGDEKSTKAVKKFAANLKNFFNNEVKRVDEFSVITHGDCWCNNMLFKYKGDIPAEVRLLDWQLSRIGSPIFDLSYFFYACSSKEVLHNLEKYLKIYQNSIRSMLNQFGCMHKIVDLSELKNQWQIYSKFGLFSALMVIKVMVTEVDEAPDLISAANSGKSVLEAITNVTSINTDVYKMRIKDIIMFMVNNDFL